MQVGEIALQVLLICASHLESIQTKEPYSKTLKYRETFKGRCLSIDVLSVGELRNLFTLLQSS